MVMESTVLYKNSVWEQGYYNKNLTKYAPKHGISRLAPNPVHNFKTECICLCVLPQKYDKGKKEK